MRFSIRRSVLVFALALLLSGCTGQVDAPSASVEPSVTASAADETQESSPAGEELAESSVLEIIERSYLRFEEQGMTERVLSGGESFVLLFDPKQPDYQAAWFNLDTGERELIFETDYFTLFVAYLMVDAPGFEIETVEGGFVLSAPDWTPISYQVSEGYLVGARGVEQDWVATFEYSVDQEFLPELEALAKELIESFD